MKKTKIVCTIGPATENVETLKKMILAGMNVARLNFSHGGYEDQEKYVKAIRQAAKEVDMPVALLLDTQGPEIRTGKLNEAPVVLKAEDEFTLVNDEIIGDNTKVSVTYKDLYKDVKPGVTILIDDGKIEIEVDRIEGKDVVCKVMNGGDLGNRKSINVPGRHINLPALKEKDINDLIEGCKHDFDYIAASFIRSADDVLAIRKVLKENGGENIKIISKIESQEGIDNFDSILEVSDGIMVARGDMGVEIPMEEVPIVQKQLIKKCNTAGKIVITATQMLESMTHQPLPTRAEASDVANAVYDRTGAIMLSGECAQGDYPVECVKTMVKIANRVEPEVNYWKRFDENDDVELDTLAKNVAYATCVTAKNMKADAIVCYTHSGSTARNLAGLGAGCPILAITDNKRTFHQLGLVWNVTPVFVDAKETINKTIEAGIEKLKSKEILEKGDLVIIAGGDQIMKDTESSVNKTLGGVLRV